jgi:hypothetical protein
MRQRIFQWLCFAALVLSLGACGSAPDEVAPELTMGATPLRTNVINVPISGTVEPGATLWVQTTAQPQSMTIEPGEPDEEGRLTWSAEINLNEEDGSNLISVSATDRVGNSRIIRRTIVRDTQGPGLIEGFLGQLSASNPEIVLWLEFDEVVGVKVDTLVKGEGAEDPRFTVRDKEQNLVSGELKALTEKKEGQEHYSIWFYWKPEEPLSPGTYEFTVPAGLADDLENVTTEPIVSTFSVQDPEATDPIP